MKDWSGRNGLHPEDEIPLIKERILANGDDFIGFNEIRGQKTFDGLVILYPRNWTVE